MTASSCYYYQKLGGHGILRYILRKIYYGFKRDHQNQQREIVRQNSAGTESEKIPRR